MISAKELDLEVQQKGLLMSQNVSTNKHSALTNNPAASRPAVWQPRQPIDNVQSGFNRGGPTPMKLGAEHD
jgi:hypothetical protein